ncbi:MAG TPA: type II toxin-antitoxin system RelE/ParE family toxin [Hyphomonadaceae bacterium]|jgi:toxin ParE1/3/4|nr:type II toxin-antitoxin system RelE/ParE family toxin [Hyphomonadaceae bacterium]
MKPVTFRPAAEADLLAIATYIAEYDPNRALSFVQRLRERCVALGAHPDLGRPRSEFGEGIRGLWEKPYVLLYRITPEAVEVLTIVHGARDLPAVIASRIAADSD